MHGSKYPDSSLLGGSWEVEPASTNSHPHAITRSIMYALCGLSFFACHVLPAYD
ncbi:unnamed protein product [Ectocarpus sp. CCAP 1310/34]|nr:unnamed protein product [Ectocarpus sp. CCAP 1310/34]